MRTKLALLALAASVALVAGCGGGGGDRLSKEEYIAAADAICAEANSSIDALGEPTEETFDDYITKAEEISREQLDKLRALKPPADDEATLNRAYDLVEQQIALAVKASEALKNQDQAAIEKASAEIDTLNAEADKIANDYGLKECGQS